jgi:glutamate synthase (NADPH/NADH) large chain
MTISALPQADGLYDPRYEHDACGVAMVARLDNQPDHGVVERALTAVTRRTLHGSSQLTWMWAESRSSAYCSRR